MRDLSISTLGSYIIFEKLLIVVNNLLEFLLSLGESNKIEVPH